MKEAVGESSMTLITITLVGAALSAIAIIIGFLLTSQSERARCENEGYSYENGKCMDGTKMCEYDETSKMYNCG